MATQAQRFERKVALRDSGCWEWTGTLNHHGYGRFYDKGRHQVQAHRWAYEAWIGVVPEGLVIDHLCRTRACVNPSHMQPVTPKENINRGRRANAEKTHCRHGHEFTKENTYKYGNQRQCRTCHHNRYLAKKSGA
jgi:hypothetical protein